MEGKSVSIYFTEEELKKLDAEANKFGVKKRSTVLRIILKKYFDGGGKIEA